MRNFLPKALAALLLVLMAGVGWGAPIKEARGMYVCRWDMGTPQDIDLVVDRAAEHGYNLLIVQVRGSADTLFKSDIEPPSYYLKNAPAGFDPLQYCIDRAHAKGIQVHAWLNTLYTWYTTGLHDDPNHITNAHPDWLMVDWNNHVVRNSGPDTEGAYTCMSHDDARAHVASVFLEVTRKYNVDGIHFDFVRYPNRRVCYCDVCLRKFRESVKPKISPEATELLDRFRSRRAYTLTFSDQWDQYRRDQVTRLVSTVYAQSKAIKPQVAVSASVFADSSDAYTWRFQEWKRWMKDGILDFLCPMAYGSSTRTVTAQIKDAISASHGQPVVAGLGAWVQKPPQLAEKIESVRKEGAAGSVMFDSASMIGNGKNDDYLTQLDQLCYREPAEMPELNATRRQP